MSAKKLKPSAAAPIAALDAGPAPDRTQAPCGESRKDGERRHKRALWPARRIADGAARKAHAQHRFRRNRARGGHEKPGKGGAGDARAGGLVDDGRPAPKRKAREQRNRGEAIAVGKAANQRLAEARRRAGAPWGEGHFGRQAIQPDPVGQPTSSLPSPGKRRPNGLHPSRVPHLQNR